jgi:putative (di)nucleoside polyphosphate hydrolase
MYRELKEETGLLQEHVSLLGCTRRWLRYQLPSRFIRRNCHPVCIGQKQIWFLLRLLGDESAFDLGACDRPEFDFWQWVDYWYPSCAVVHFKRTVYSEALNELADLLPGGAKRHERGRQRRPHAGR